MADKTVGNKKTTPIALTALLFSMLSLIASVGYFWLGPINPAPKLEDAIADRAVEIRDKVVARLKGEKVTKETHKSQWDADRIAQTSIASTSVLAILLAVIAFVRHEPLRMVGSAAALGTIALAFQFFVIAVGAIVFAIILAAVLGGLGFS